MSDISRYLRTEYAGIELHEVLRQPTYVLLGVNPAAASALNEIGVESIFDLGSSWLFANARVAAEAGQLSTTAGRIGLAPSDWLKPTASFESLDDIASLPLENLRGLTDADALTLKTALDVTTIRDFAFWPPRQVAHKLVSDAVGTVLDPEEQQSEELRPRLGEYPTERVYYNTLTMLQMDEDAKRSPLQAPISLMPAVNQPMGFGKVAVGALLTYSQSWYAKGVTLGHMLHSLALAPGEATRIAVIDWSRRTSATAAEAITETEQLDNSTLHARAISEVQNAVANELQRGGSMTSGWAKSHSESTADTGSSGLINSVLNESGSSSSTTQDASTATFAQSASWSIGKRSISASMTQNINDRTEQHSNSVRNRRASAVREVSQSEHEEVSTRIVANYNHMHALTIQYYEVVQVYQVDSQLHNAERCLFVPFELLDFSTPNAMDIVERFRGALVRGALTARARDLLIDETTMVAIKPIVKMSVPRPDIIGRFTTGPLRMSPASADLSPEKPATSDESQKAIIASAVQVWNRDQVLRVSRVLGRSALRPGSDALYLTDETELLGISFSGVNISSVRIDRPGAATTENTFTVPANSAQIDLPQGIRLSELDAIFLAKAENPPETGSMTLNCAFRGQQFTTPAVAIELATGTAMQKVVTLQTDEADRRRELIAHLQANRAYYSQAVFRSLDSATLVMLLSAFTWNGKSLVDQVEPTPLAAAGNYLVLRAPVDSDERSGVLENGSNLTWGEVIKQRGIDFTISNARLVPVPTGGVFAEAVLGRSNSAEKLDITRFWNWKDSPIPLQPPEISPVGTGTRGTTEDLKPGSLSSPVLNIVNPTSLPDPAGLAASLGALASANLFRDMSGLQGTQALSQAAMRETLAAASQAGQLASTNLQTEAQKAVAMGQIAADIAKTAMGIPNTNSTDGISAEGARINHGRDMDERGVSAPGGASPGGGGAGGGSEGSEGGGMSGGGDMSGDGSSGSGGGFSREGAYADRGAFGYSPDAVGAATDTATKSISIDEVSQQFAGSSQSHELSASKKNRINKARKVIPAGPGMNIVDISDDSSVIRGRILIANFDVNSSDLKSEAYPVLEEVAAALNSSSDAAMYIEGRASQTGPEAWNVELSERRSDEVYAQLIALGVDFNKIIEVIGLGSSDPIVDKPEKEEPLNRSVRLVYQIPLPDFVKKEPPLTKSTGSKKWAIRLQLSGGAGHAGVGGAGAIGELKNLETGEVRQGSFQGGGIGVGLQSPGVDPGFGDWNEFETDARYTFEDFDGTLARLTTAGGGIALIGYSLAYISFPNLGANSISVGGWNMGAIGADASSNVGWWNVIGM